MTNRWLVHATLLLSNILLALGLFAPSLTVHPAFGQHTTLVLLIEPQWGQAQSISLYGGIISLYSDGHFWVAGIITLFSVLFPLWKLGVLWASVVALDCKRAVAPNLRLIEKLGKFSMLDIFVMAVLVLLIKKLPGGTSIEIEWGLYAFAASIVLSLFLPGWLEKLSKRQGE